jgi:hypothetical protein
MATVVTSVSLTQEEAAKLSKWNQLTGVSKSELVGWLIMKAEVLDLNHHWFTDEQKNSLNWA